MLKSILIQTPLGPMTAIADEQALYLLEFSDQPGLDRAIKKLEKINKTTVVAGKNSILDLITKELERYFAGKSQNFLVPCAFSGTDFQNSVWRELQKIPFGMTCAYGEIAQNLGKPTAFRAVAQANSANMISIVIPCHRVINRDGTLGGYSGTLERKRRLIQMETTPAG